MSEKLSVVIITLNEDKNIKSCLDAAWQVADEIVVVDSYSTDNTKMICLKNGVHFYENEFHGYIEQKKYASSLAKHDLILSLDADEVLSNQLISSIRKIKVNPLYDGYQLNRLSYYVDRFIKHGHWFPDKNIRLYKKGRGQLIGKNPHDQYELFNKSKSPVLSGVLYHYTFKSISEHLRQSDHFSETGSKQLSNQNTFYLVLKALFSPLWGFFYGYIGRLGFLDGWHGLIIAIISSNETFLKYTKEVVRRIELKDGLIGNKTDISISLIISTYNWPQALKQSLNSIKRQNLLPNEVLIADDGSGEDTRKLIEDFEKDFPVPLIHCRIEDKGFRLAKSRNVALKKAKFDYILQIDGDIIMHKNFVNDHSNFAKRGSFVRGSRVLMNKRITQRIFNNQLTTPGIFSSGTTNFFNGLRIPVFQKVLNQKNKSIEGIRGCNMGYWREDAFAVNGYNEEIQGWGREDSEFVARLINNGVFKRVLRLGGIQYHIYHKEYDRKLLNKNDEILKKTVDSKLVRCNNGIIKV